MYASSLVALGPHLLQASKIIRPTWKLDRKAKHFCMNSAHGPGAHALTESALKIIQIYFNTARSHGAHTHEYD